MPQAYSSASMRCPRQSSSALGRSQLHSIYSDRSASNVCRCGPVWAVQHGETTNRHDEVDRSNRDCARYLDHGDRQSTEGSFVAVSLLGLSKTTLPSLP